MRNALLVAALLLAGPAFAGDIDCGKADNQTDMDMCASRDYVAADKELNRLYTELMAKYEPKYRVMLRDAEKRWIAYRDSECDFETAPSFDGSVYPMVRALCMTEKTNARIKELQVQRDCVEGDMSCNRP